VHDVIDVAAVLVSAEAVAASTGVTVKAAAPVVFPVVMSTAVAWHFCCDIAGIYFAL
jgi:hypothetical protein